MHFSPDNPSLHRFQIRPVVLSVTVSSRFMTNLCAGDDSGMSAGRHVWAADDGRGMSMIARTANTQEMQFMGYLVIGATLCILSAPSHKSDMVGPTLDAVGNDPFIKHNNPRK